MTTRTAAPAVSASAETMVDLGEVRLCYQTFGDPSAEPLLLVMGLGGPMTWWDPEFCTSLAEAGFFVIRYDNRDTGRSSRIDRPVAKADVVRAFFGMPVRAPYAIADLADDAFGLLDSLGIDRAHLAGISMGGMIAQTMAIARPERVASLTSIMSSTGSRRVGWQHPRLLPNLIGKRGAGRDAYVAISARSWRLIGSPGYPGDPEAQRIRAEETWDRGVSASGVLRQMLAVLTQPDRTAALGELSMPVTVIHGMSDRMVHRSGGRATAAAVPGAELLLVDGMGHDLPQPCFGLISTAIRRTADRSRGLRTPTT